MRDFKAPAPTVFPAESSSKADSKTVVEGNMNAPMLVKLMADELDYSMKHLVNDDGTRPYYLAYTITDVVLHSIVAQDGALYQDDTKRYRINDVDVRVGNYALDNTHKIRGRDSNSPYGYGGGNTISIEDNSDAIRHALWQATDRQFKIAIQRYQQVVTNRKTMVEEESKVDDFSREDPIVYFGDDAVLDIDQEAWVDRVKATSEMAMTHPLIYTSWVSLSALAENRFMVSNEGTRLKTGRKRLRVVLSALTKAEDGMDLSKTFIFNTSTEEGLPSENQMREAFEQLIGTVLSLRDAPIIEPYTGPAILMNRASGVFFHEIFGHRIEGHRQKDVDEGQTFAKMVGQPILPEFISISDDPTRADFAGEDLRGFYHFDDEGIPAMRVDLVDKGILKEFLLSRSPIPGFNRSNAHGRREPGYGIISRQGNLLVQSDRTVTFKQLRKLLIEECRKQNKPYGFLFEDITGGYTTTSRRGPQAFKVLPVEVYRVYADGSPDELVRGVDIVGTPLSCFSQIICTGDDFAVFNGNCGAESGWVPVSAISPSILVRQIEIEKQQQSQERLPILLSPITAHDIIRGTTASSEK